MDTETFNTFTDFGDVDWSDATQTAAGTTEACWADTLPALAILNLCTLNRNFLGIVLEFIQQNTL